MSDRAQEHRARQLEREAREAADAAGARRRRRLLQLGLVTGLALALVVAGIVISRSSSDPVSPGGRARSGVAGAAETATLLRGIAQSGTVLGDPRAPVTLTEYADLQCPFCRDYTLQVLPALIDRYVRQGRVKLDLRLLRFLGPDSDRAARAAVLAADRGRYWNFVDLFYRNQGAEGSGYATDAFVRRIGGAVPGLDGGALVARAGDPAVESRLVGFERAAKIAGVDSTPSFTLTGANGTARALKVDRLDAAAFNGPIDAALKGAG